MKKKLTDNEIGIIADTLWKMMKETTSDREMKRLMDLHDLTAMEFDWTVEDKKHEPPENG